MVFRTLKRTLALLGAGAVIAAGCDSANTVPKHGADDQKAIDSVKAMTPQQRIDMIEKGPMPASAKQAMIKQIKDQNGLK